MNADTGEIAAHVLTEGHADDAAQVPTLLGQAEGVIASVTADGAYDGEPTYAAAAARQRHRPPDVVVPPRMSAVPSSDKGDSDVQSPRDRHIQLVEPGGSPDMAERGRIGWQQATGYGRRSQAETTMARYKHLIGPKLRARSLPAQRGEAAIAVAVLNTMVPGKARLRPGRLDGARERPAQPRAGPCNNAACHPPATKCAAAPLPIPPPPHYCFRRAWDVRVTMEPELLPRHLQGILEEALRASRVVNLIGPRQVGKTTLVRDLLPGGHFVTLDDAAVLGALRADPMGQIELLVARAGEGAVILDEAQRAPEMATAIKKVVDGNRRKGQFLLTGSSNIFTTAAVTDTLAGRVMTLTLLPLSTAEIHRAGPGRMFDWAAAGADVSRLPAIPRITRQGVLDLVARGGYPELRNLTEQRTRTRAYRAYVDSIVDKDVAELLAVRKTDALRRLIGQLAARSSGELNYDALCGVVGITRKTLDPWLDALERLSIIRRLGSWASGETHREIRHPKLHLVDTGLLCALRNLSAGSFGLDADPTALGAVLETFVFCEVSKSLPHQEDAWDLFHWRDRHGREIDILAMCPPAALVGIEVKASASVGAEDFKHLRWFATEGPGRNREMTGIVIYLGEEAVSFGPRMVALPLQAFWADWNLQASSPGMPRQA